MYDVSIYYDTMILHYRFLVVPKVKKVVYSTCSIHEIENERVVQKALFQHPDFELINIMDDWPRRGLSSPNFPEGKKAF
jgi:putative methyltransferase